MEEFRDRDDDGVPIAPADAARLDEGGRSTTRFGNSSARMGSIERGGGLRAFEVIPCSLCMSIDGRGGPASGISGVDALRWNTFPSWLSSGCVLSLDR